MGVLEISAQQVEKMECGPAQQVVGKPGTHMGEVECGPV